MTFPELEDFRKRTDTTFRARLHQKHHKGLSPLIELDLNMTTGFPLDYMHLVLLGDGVKNL